MWDSALDFNIDGKELVNDVSTKQYWMIWGGQGATTEYSCTAGGFMVVNGPATYNRPLYARNGSTITLAGDKPQVMLADAPSSKYGNLTIGVIIGDKSKWLHDFDKIVSWYNPGMQRYELTDPIFSGTIKLDVLPLSEDPGFIIRISSDRPVKLLWVYGGLSKGYDIIGQGGYDGGIIAKECSDEILVDRRKNIFCLSKRSLPKIVYGGSTCNGTFHVCAAQFSNSPLTLIGFESKKNIGITKEGRLRHPDTYVSYPILAQEVEVGLTPCYIVVILSAKMDDTRIMELLSKAEAAYFSAVRKCKRVQEQIVVKTPDEELDLAIKATCVSMDATWYPPSFMHGTLRWGYESGGWFLGWRGWYGPIAFGWHDRVAKAIRFHSHYQLEEPSQGPDSKGKVWPYVPFSGAIDHRPNGIYDMTQVYLDHIYYYYNWTGDKSLLKELFPVIKNALDWERREFDPDGDGLYENFANTWISDGHWYSGGGCTQASAYNYRANLLAAEAARLTGCDDTPFLLESEKIKNAMNQNLWIREMGHFAEYKEFLGFKRLHTAAEAPTIYHPIDFQVTDDFQSYQSLRYLENRLWKFDDLILVNDWYPVIVTNGTLALAETLNTAIAYYRLGEKNKAYRLLKASLRSFYHARVPGEISCYVNEKGDQGTYVGFTDAISMFGRTVVEGLFGILPKMQEDMITIQPAFPEEWNSAKISTPYIEFEYHRDIVLEKLTVKTTKLVSRKFRIATRNGIEKVMLDGVDLPYRIVPGIGKAFLEAETQACKYSVLEVKHSIDENEDPGLVYEPVASARTEYCVEAKSCRLVESYDPQGVFASCSLTDQALSGQISSLLGRHTLFVKVESGKISWWEPVDLEIREGIEVLRAELIVAREGKVSYQFELRNNTSKPLKLEVVSEFVGECKSETISLMPKSSHIFRVRIENTLALTPGTNMMRVHLSGDLVLSLDIPVRFWRLFEALTDQKQHFIERCEPIPLQYNDSLSEVFKHEFTKPRSPFTSLEIDIHGLNAWTGSWYSDEYVNTNHIIEQLTSSNVFISDIGVPFSQVRTGKNGVFISLWDTYPSLVKIPVNRIGSKMYLLIAGTTHNSQTYITNGIVNINYSDGTRQIVELFNPKSYDSMFQHFSDNYPQWIGGKRDGYYGVGTASGIHADILDISLERKMVNSVEISCLSNEIVIGVLGLTICK